MTNSITPDKQCEVWGRYNSIHCNWEDAFIERKKCSLLCMRIAVYLQMFWTDSEQSRETKEGPHHNHLLSPPPLLAGHGNSSSIINASYIFAWPDSLIVKKKKFPQLAQIKEKLQSPSRRRELKGLLSSNSSDEPSAEWSDVCPSQAVPSSPLPLLLSHQTTSPQSARARRRWRKTHWAPKHWNDCARVED